MKIPNKVKIGGYTYSVEREDAPYVIDDVIAHGSHNYPNLQIKVGSFGTLEYQESVFLHELIHGIIAVYCANRQDEEFVEQLSKGLYQVIVDNPKIFKCDKQ